VEWSSRHFSSKYSKYISTESPKTSFLGQDVLARNMVCPHIAVGHKKLFTNPSVQCSIVRRSRYLVRYDSNNPDWPTTPCSSGSGISRARLAQPEPRRGAPLAIRPGFERLPKSGPPMAYPIYPYEPGPPWELYGVCRV
jgi:hypothetical protein